jgi:hypothetical protein
VQVIGLLVVSVVFWALFLKAESGAAEPILDLGVLGNRSFLTVSGAGFLSFRNERKDSSIRWNRCDIARVQRT